MRTTKRERRDRVVRPIAKRVWPGSLEWLEPTGWKMPHQDNELIDDGETTDRQETIQLLLQFVQPRLFDLILLLQLTAFENQILLLLLQSEKSTSPERGIISHVGGARGRGQELPFPLLQFKIQTREHQFVRICWYLNDNHWSVIVCLIGQQRGRGLKGDKVLQRMKR